MLTKKKQSMKEKREKKAQQKEKLKMAAQDFLAGKFSNLRQAAQHYGVYYGTLYKVLNKNGGEFKGTGQFSQQLSAEEEKKIVAHVKWRQEIGYGLDWQGLQRLIQEILVRVTQSNPDRVTGLESWGQLPEATWVRRFAE